MELNESKLLVVKFVRLNGIDALKDKFSIQVRQSNEFPNLYSLRYNQLQSPFTRKIVQECRGLILDEKNNWEPVALPYIKFFNYGEKCAAKIDWTTAKVYEKLDGTMIDMYWYGDKWNVASIGVPDASMPLNREGPTIAEIFWRIWKEMGYNDPIETTYVYLFEMTSKENIIQVIPDKDIVTLHGVRDMKTLEELSPEPVAKENGWLCVKTVPLSNLNEVVDAARLLKPTEAEGYVVCDAKFNRVKVKSPAYVALAHMCDSKKKHKQNYRNMVEVVRVNEGDEFLTYFPQHATIYGNVKRHLDALTECLETCYKHTLDKLNPDSNVADFESMARRQVSGFTDKSEYITILLKLYNKEIPSLRSYFAHCSMSHLINLLRYWKEKCEDEDEDKREKVLAEKMDTLDTNKEDDDMVVKTGPRQQTKRGKNKRRGKQQGETIIRRTKKNRADDDLDELMMNFHSLGTTDETKEDQGNPRQASKPSKNRRRRRRKGKAQ